MNTSQVPMRHPTPPHLNLTINLWAGLLIFTDDAAPSEGISPGHVSPPPSLALRAPKMPPSLHYDSCQAPHECQLQNFQQKCHITGGIKLLFDNTGFLIVRDTHSLKSPSIYTHSAVTVHQLSCLMTLSHAFSRNSKTLYLMLVGKAE